MSDKSEIVTIQLHKEDLAALLDTIMFAKQASSLLAYEEIKKGSGLSGATKMQKVLDNATSLYKILYPHYDIGDPLSDVLN